MENNKLIAEFMGYEIAMNTRMVLPNFIHAVNLDLFQTSWNYLMPVVDKIEAELEEEFRVVILEHECSIYKKTEDNKLQIVLECVAEGFGTSKIEATHEAVVEFIKQHNK